MQAQQPSVTSVCCELHAPQLTQALTEADEDSFSSESINIEITCPDVPDLTLIDLPGIVRTTTKGQPQAVIRQVDSLVEKYLTQPRTIVLAVVPSNTDVATVDILERARIFDPTGIRTIGVLTKPDLIDIGSEAEVMEVLLNNRKPLTLGYTMVKNRSQLDVTNGVSLASARQHELAFFREHKFFSNFDPSYFGVENLTARLVKLLFGRIRATLPLIRSEVDDLLKETRQIIEVLGVAPPATPHEQYAQLVSVTDDIAGLLGGVIDGSMYSHQLVASRGNMLCCYARAYDRFTELQIKIVALKPKFDDPGYHSTLAERIATHRGHELPGFMNYAVFEAIM